MKPAESKIIMDALKRNNFSRKETAAELGMHKSTLFRKIKSLELVLPDKKKKKREDDF